MYHFLFIKDENSMPPGLQPAHKMSIILFLERVYGIPDQETFFRLIEEAFLPDIRAATILDTVNNLFNIYFVTTNQSCNRQQ
jgi:hypothetical protein